MDPQKTEKIPIKVKNHVNSREYGIYSTKDFEEGEEIYIVKPLVAILDEKHLPNGCSNCFICEEEEEDAGLYLMPCKACKVLQYCCQKCMEEDWAMFHQYECSFFLSKWPKIIPGFMRICMRLIFYGRNHPCSLEWNTIKELEGHVSEIMSSERKEEIWILSKGIQNFTNEPNEKLVLSLLCKIMINSFSLFTSSYDTIGTAIDLTISRIDHSCYPNATLVFDGNKIALRSLQKIFIDQEITISYIDVNNTQKNRQDELLSRYYFLCKCIRCKSQEKDESYHILKNTMSIETFFHLEMLINKALNEKNINILRVLSILHRLKGWNAVLYPLNQLHKLALMYFLDENKIYNAFCHGLYIHLIGNRVSNQYMIDFNPIYVIQKFVLIKLMIFQASENYETQFKQINAKDMMIYAYKLLYDVIKLSYKSHGSSSRLSKRLQKIFEKTGEDISVYDWGKYWQSILKDDPENLLIKKECLRIEHNFLSEVKKYIEICIINVKFQ
ncbi:hypothetical protein T552_01277 [Pneumocystis carinii B80]|uniref:MYND-type domain-containing protein n=1 Tax=Pneumocystis carinii (strain B80) TaxID=1408658 RepID=A0A0W4ZLR6_PNEC8|nr:hypothetical protein T552_01277 [Pneumocystis carinii B80]KTW29322.1 hypothetical protein T552_01277 [Pneumocystis carinii B80]